MEEVGIRLSVSAEKVRSSAYSKGLSFYSTPPTEEVTLEEFEQYSLDRILVLKELEDASIRGLSEEKTAERLGKIVDRLLPMKKDGDSVNYEDIRKDVISHFALRLAYCGTETKRSFLLKFEKELMKYRLMRMLDPRKISSFLVENGLMYTQVTSSEYSVLKSRLETLKTGIWKSSSSHGQAQRSTSHADYFKIPFEEALELVRRRACLVDNGYAIVQKNEMITVALGRFRARLAASLVGAYKAYPFICSQHPRLCALLETLTSAYLGEDYGKNVKAGSVSLADIDKLAITHFPLCMRDLHFSLRESHHLKHEGRMQYGLFLKGIGLSLEDAIAFWRSEFSQIITDKKFETQYAYNIRHNYGKEGSRLDYTPYSCLKIINSAPIAGAVHGCPYSSKHGAVDSLIRKLQGMNIKSVDIEDITNYATKHHYQIACRKCFEATHQGCEEDLNVTHPNQYFEKAKIFFGKSKGAKNDSEK